MSEVNSPSHSVWDLLDAAEEWVLGPLSTGEGASTRRIFVPPAEAEERPTDLRPLLVCYVLFAMGLVYHRRMLFLIVALPVCLALTVYYVSAVRANLGKGKGWPDAPTGPEPAYRNYFFYKALKDYELILNQSVDHARRVLLRLWNIIRLLVANPVLPLTWFPGMFAAAFIGAAVLSAFAVAASIGVIHMLLVLIVCAVMIVTAYLLRGLEYGFMQIRRIIMVCPAAGCYRHIPLPVYLCSGCHAEHRRLIPGSYGIFTRRCRCDRMLPASTFRGRSRLQGLCPNEGCNHLLPNGVEDRRIVHISLVGGPAAGKTTLLGAAVNELRCRSDAGTLNVEIQESHSAGFHQRVCERLAYRGEYPLKTRAELPDAVVIYLQDRNRHRTALYLYDSAGEAFDRSDKLRGQRFHEYASGVLFLVDPDAVRRFRLANPQQQGADRETSDPQTIYDRYLGKLRETKHVRGRLANPAVAIVITKADQIRDARLTTCDEIVSWLDRNGLDNLVRSVNNDFLDVTFVASTILPKTVSPDGSAAADQAGLRQTADWILAVSGCHSAKRRNETSASVATPSLGIGDATSDG